MIFKQLIHSLLSIYFTLLILFMLSRVYWFLSFVKQDLLKYTSIWDIFYVFMMSIRLDSSASVFILLVPFAGSFIFPFINIAQLTWRKFVKLYVIVALILTVSLIILNHYYYYYYKAHFNLFFWEFWINWENSKLVIWSIFDELPIYSVLFSFLCFIVIGFSTFHLINKLIGKTLRKHWLFHFPGFIIWIIFLVIAGRATFDRLPLLLQFNRGLISTNMFLNKAHANPIYTLYFSWRQNDDTALIKAIVKEAKSLDNVKQYYDTYASSNKYRSVKQQDSSYSIQYKVMPLQQLYLHKKPKHIVVIFMESFFSWPFNINENGFNKKVGQNFLKLKENGLYFSNYFRASTGTIQNIYKTILGIPTPRELSLENLREQYQNWQTFPRSMNKHGYRPRFFYGGSLAWHRLHHFLKETGFEDVYGENSVKDVPHSRFGIFDEHLFDFVHDSLNNSTGNTFNFIMTLSNHPPYQMPDSYEVKDLTIPPILKPYATDEEYFTDRFTAFSYSDTALGQFMEKAKSSAYYKDTLFIITADHPVDYFSDWDFTSRYKLEKIPLLVYGSLLKNQNAAEIINRGTHLDLLPTILSLINIEEEVLTSWGKSLLLKPKEDFLNSYFVNCLNNFCTTPSGNQLLGNNQKLIMCAGITCESQEKQLTAQRKAFEMSGIYFLLNHK